MNILVWWARLQSHASAKGELGMRMAIGAVLFLGASWLFGGMAEDVATGDPITVADVYIAQWLHMHATPLVTQWMLVFTHLHGIAAISSYVVLVAAYLAWRRNWYWLLCVVITVPSGMLLNVLMKLAFQRARPSFEEPLLALTTYSFPSGHVAGATLFYGVLVAMLIVKIKKRHWQTLLVVGAIGLVGLVALTRMYLGAHYLSDVIAAFAEGVAWVALCLISIHRFSERRRGASPASY